jgi:hypothetical protein
MTSQAEPIAHDLDAALATASEAHTRFVKALMEFGRRFPGDHRRFGVMAATDPEKMAFEAAQAEVSASKAEDDAAQSRWELACRGAPK